VNGKPGRLGVVVDGQALPEEEARAFWGRFSDHMDANRGDLRGFAEKEGLASVHPTMQGDRPVLVASRSGTQKPYTNAPTVKPPEAARGASSGSPGPQRQAPRGGPPGAARGDPPNRGKK
jgi:hypothetical protein